MKALAAFLFCCPLASASESFSDGAARIAVEFAERRDQEEAEGARHAEQMAAMIQEMIEAGIIETQAPSNTDSNLLSSKAYFGVSNRTYLSNSPWTEMREDLENFFRGFSHNTHIAWFEPLHGREGDGKTTVSYPYVVRTDLPRGLLPVGIKPLKEILILILGRVRTEDANWHFVADTVDDELTQWNLLIRKDHSQDFKDIDGGALLIARFGDVAPGKSEWRLLEAYEFDKPYFVSRPSFRALHSLDTEPQGAKILRFKPRCEDNVKK